LGDQVIVPPAVVEEIGAGREHGINLPEIENLNWMEIRQPLGKIALPLVTDLGPGETEALMLLLEEKDAVGILDDALARRVASTLGLKYTGTLGVLLDAKHLGIIPAITPFLDELDSLGFRLALETRHAICLLAGEND